MYDELVKRLREMSEWSNIKWEDYSDDAQETMGEAADAIEELSEDRDSWKATAKVEREAYWHWFDQYQKDVPRWIPVTERLPEKYAPVLVCYRSYNTGEPMADCNAYVDGDGDWCWHDGFPASGERVCVSITHWMTLPEPPKEEGNSNAE